MSAADNSAVSSTSSNLIAVSAATNDVTPPPTPMPPPTAKPSLKRTRLSIPHARIKRLMQADEDVGRVAKTTPVAVCRAVELFVQDLIQTSLSNMQSDETKLEAKHLQTAAKSTERFDFLNEIFQSDAATSEPAAKKARVTPTQ